MTKAPSSAPGWHGKELSDKALYTTDVLRMIKRRVAKAGLSNEGVVS
jgi:hypothetical protein